MNADIVSMQEVVFGARQLDELAVPTTDVKPGTRHSLNLEEIGASNRSMGYHPYEAPVQLPIFVHLRNPDPNAALDGNAILLDARFEESHGTVTEKEYLHLSAYRNI